MQIVNKNVNELFPYINNARQHSETQVTQIASSIIEFGFTNPLLIDDDGGIVAGHGRLLAAKKLNLDSVPCIVLEGLTEAKKKSLVIADNKLAVNATWDEELLKIELESLIEMDADIGLTGFDSNELDNLLREVEDETAPKEIDYAEKFSILIEFSNEEEQEEAFKELSEMGYKCQVQSL